MKKHLAFVVFQQMVNAAFRILAITGNHGLVTEMDDRSRLVGTRLDRRLTTSSEPQRRFVGVLELLNICVLLTYGECR
jgi:hypothetical protein